MAFTSKLLLTRIVMGTGSYATDKIGEQASYPNVLLVDNGLKQTRAWTGENGFCPAKLRLSRNKTSSYCRVETSPVSLCEGEGICYAGLW